MSEGLNRLKDIGAQVIHNETHISREYVQAMIHEIFDDLQSVPFIGFISILEREYDVDLSDLQAKGKQFFKEKDEKSQEIKEVFVTTNSKSSNSMIYVTLGLVLFLSFAYYTFFYLDSMTLELEKLDNTKIEYVTKSINPVPIEKKLVEVTQKKIEEPIVEPVVETEPEVQSIKSLKI